MSITRNSILRAAHRNNFGDYQEAENYAYSRALEAGMAEAEAEEIAIEAGIEWEPAYTMED